ncbi:MAG: ATP synthase F0 subunit B [Candidatus Hydrogenedentota bacterium]|nr:MAG: ATP synthase F0 subunit B [Candidatus Hydrogenedentota bacterium]
MLLFLVTAAAEHGGEATGGGAIIAPDFAVTIATWVTFGLLVFFLSRYGWGPFTKALDEREEKIANDVRKAEEARAEAQRLLEEYESRLGRARSEADKIIVDARQRAEEIAARLKKEAQADAAETIEKARQAIEAEREAAVVELKSTVAEAAVSLASKILREDLDRPKHERLIEETVREITPH